MTDIVQCTFCASCVACRVVLGVPYRRAYGATDKRRHTRVMRVLSLSLSILPHTLLRFGGGHSGVACGRILGSGRGDNITNIPIFPYFPNNTKG